MRKGLALLLALALLLTSCAALAEETAEPISTTDIALLGRPLSDEPTHLTVGNTTKVSGGFFTELWSNNTSDIDVRTMLHGYNTVVWDSQVEFITDPQVVRDVSTTTTAEGTCYTISLWDDLTYNDGETKITAADYVFSLLLNASPQVVELGGISTSCQHIVGYEAYHAGETPYFSGVRLVNDYTFSITVKAEYLPFFFEMANIRVNPYPISVIAPGCAVADSRDGAHFVNAEDPEAEAPFTAELLRENEDGRKKAAERLADIGSRLAVSDAGCAAALLHGGLRAASLNVYINTKAMPDRDAAEGLNHRCGALLRRGTALADAVFDRVKRELTTL